MPTCRCGRTIRGGGKCRDCRQLERWQNEPWTHEDDEGDDDEDDS